MAKLRLKSKQQILGAMIRTVLARTGLNDLNPGSVLLTLLQAVANSIFALYYQMLQIIRNYNLDTTTGSDLDNRAFEYGLTRKQALPATGRVKIMREDTFVEISTTFYSGFRSRISGDTEIFLNNAADFPTSGGQKTLIIGRGTPNEEEVTYTASTSNPEDHTNYYLITLDVPLANDHALEETVLLRQGTDTLIESGTILVVPASGRTPEIAFETTVDATILAGEDSVDDVNVRCTQPGVIGNIGVTAITGTTAFQRPPFDGARAQNDSAFSNGQSRETDPTLRDRIKAHIQSISQSTVAGIANAVDGLVDSTTAKRVVSSNIILPDNAGEPVKIYIDDGTGFEPDFEERGQETIISSARGSEERLQLDLFPLVKAQVETLLEEPFNMDTDELTLQVNVGSASETIEFTENQFNISEAATAEEIVRAINDNAVLFEARTSQVGKKVVISAKSDVNEDIQVVGGTATAAGRLVFPTSLVQTFYLYKNDRLLSKDGTTAFVDSAVEPFDFSGVTPKELGITIDGKTANTQTATIGEDDFDSPSAAGSATAAQVAAIINAQIAGAVASAVSGKVRILSNTELSSASKIKIESSTAATEMGFSTTEVVGSDQDYTLNSELGVIQLTAPLEQYDLITTGTRNTRAFLTASMPQNYTLTSGQTLVWKVDRGSPQTITLTAGTNISAAAVVADINAQLVGATAVTRTVGASIYLEVRTNTLDSSVGAIELDSSSTANDVFGFAEDTEVSNLTPHTAFRVSGASGPFTFIEGSTLVVVMNEDSSHTLVITMDYDAEASAGTSTTVFAASDLSSVFTEDDELNDFWVVFKSGGNTTEGTVDLISNPTGTTFKYTFSNPAPANYQDFAVGDQVTFSDMESAANNGTFLITSVATVGDTLDTVESLSFSNPSDLTSISTGDRYLVGADAGLLIHADVVVNQTVSNPSGLTPTLGDRHIIAPDATYTLLTPVVGSYADSADASVQEVHGYRYIVSGTGLNDWAGHDNQIAEYNGVGTPGWLFTTPSDKDAVEDQGAATIYQFSSSTGTWTENKWGGKAGKIAEWDGSTWSYTTPADGEVRTVTAEGLNYQYDTATGLWTENAWGGEGNNLAEWSGTVWTFETPTTNDTVFVTAEDEVYQFDGDDWAVFKFWVQVTNAAGVASSAAESGTGSIGIRRNVSDYVGATGEITLASPARAIPAADDEFVVIPGTKENVVAFFNNTKVTSLSTKAYVELAEANEYIQISSKENGSDGAVQVTGGRANDLLEFSNSLNRGLRAYAYYTGLIKLVHSTLYGDEQDLVSFPGVGAAGVKFQILAPTVQEISFSLDVTLSEGITLSSVENEIKTKIIAYVNRLGVSKPVILSAIVAKVREVQGIVDVEINTPTENVTIATNELARTKASVISINVVV